MDELIAALLWALKGAGLAAVKAFPEGMMPRLAGSVTAVGIQEMKNTGGGAYTYLGMRADEAGVLRALYGRQLETEALLQIYCPRSLGGRACMAESERVAALLAGMAGGMKIASFSVGPCSYDAVSDCFCCTITAKVRAYLYALANDDETEFTDFILKGEVK